MDKVVDVKKIEGIIEALLFASGDKVYLDTISKIISKDKSIAKKIINNMIYQYESSARGITIRQIDEYYQMCTKPEVYDNIKDAFEPKTKQTLSQASFETLSIVAYNGPVTKLKIEEIRGVNSDSALKKLEERELVREVGRLNTPGKPSTFDVTDEFYRQFGFRSKADLPVLEMKDFSDEGKNE